MRKGFFFTLILLVSAILIVSYFYFSERVYPGIYLSKKTFPSSKDRYFSLFRKSFGYSFNIQVHEKAYPMKYKQMGILLDKIASERVIFEGNHLSFPHNMIAFFRSLNGQKMVFTRIYIYRKLYGLYRSNPI